VIQDCRTLDGRRMRHATLIVASPPCDDFSRWDQPWTRARWPAPPNLDLWRSAERIAREAGVPLVIENVRGAQYWCGPARAHFGKQYLWGDVPALLPHIGSGQNFGRQKQSLSSTKRALRAEIPFPLARYIAQVFKPYRQNDLQPSPGAVGATR
jgi:site-specific DNA-cytosine methylase